jgi:hypothetical protein
MKHRWKNKIRLYEVTYTGMVEVAFDKKPSGNALEEALADNLRERLANSLYYGYLNADDIKFELIEVRRDT